jgi:hypothetical protein
MIYIQETWGIYTAHAPKMRCRSFKLEMYKYIGQEILGCVEARPRYVHKYTWAWAERSIRKLTEILERLI